MPALFKQKCYRCKKNYVLATWRQRFSECYGCQKNELSTPVKDKKMKKMFDIPEELYVKSAFLRSIKINFLRYGSLSDKQIVAFKSSVEKMLSGKTPPEEPVQ
ncbi:MAG TPA: hypothetical protein VJI75_00930 [Candidatus Nanoarchaeia archaeon]|nr:hypothetical protein [Candidatus Nanoarchaeia archaeon]